MVFLTRVPLPQTSLLHEATNKKIYNFGGGPYLWGPGAMPPGTPLNLALKRRQLARGSYVNGKQIRVRAGFKRDLFEEERVRTTFPFSVSKNARKRCWYRCKEISFHHFPAADQWLKYHNIGPGGTPLPTSKLGYGSKRSPTSNFLKTRGKGKGTPTTACGPTL